MRMLLAISALLVSTSSFALSEPVVEKVKQVSDIIADCPVCQGGKLVTTTTLTVSVHACMTYPVSAFHVVVDEVRLGISRQTEKTVAVVLRNAMDCMGPTRTQNYDVTTTELEEGERYILLNPSVLK